MKRLSETLSETAKYLFIAAVAASFVFIGWRIVTKRSYEAQERLQCRVLAASAALSAAEAVQEPALAASVREEKISEFIIDHMKMPGNYVVKVTIHAEKDGSFKIDSAAATGWNTRSPQDAAFEMKTDGFGKTSFGGAEEKKLAGVIAALRKDKKTAFIKNKRLVFTYAFEKPCPAPFEASAAKSSGFSEEPVVLLFFEK